MITIESVTTITMQTIIAIGGVNFYIIFYVIKQVVKYYTYTTLHTDTSTTHIYKFMVIIAIRSNEQY